jgi:pseudaminic acid synthase
MNGGSISIAGKVIREDSPAFIVAELSANHRQSLECALKTIRAAKEAGADAIKLQTYTPDTITLDCENEYFLIRQGTVWDGRTLYDLYQETYTPWEWHARLKEAAEAEGLVFFSTPFDKSAVDFLEELDVPAYKIASFEITDIPLIEYIAARKKPVLLSTGVASVEEIEEAISACRRAGNDQIVLLKCTSSYPTRLCEANLNTIPDLQRRFKTAVGLSDHTQGAAAPVAAVVLGARIVEKHLILDRTLGGPDVSFSIEPEEFRSMVELIRNVQESLGRVSYELPDGNLNRDFCRSLFVCRDIAAGEEFTETNVKSVRPGFGLPPKLLPEILKRRAAKDLKKGTPLSWSVVA